MVIIYIYVRIYVSDMTIFNLLSISGVCRNKTPYDPKYEIQHLMAPQRMGRKSPQLLTAPLLLSILSKPCQLAARGMNIINSSVSIIL